MIWYLIFCSTIPGAPSSCISPPTFRAEATCKFIGQHLAAAARSGNVTWRCVLASRPGGANG